MNGITFTLDTRLIPKYSKLSGIGENTTPHWHLRANVGMTPCHRPTGTDPCLSDIVIRMVVCNARCCRRNNVSAGAGPVDFS